MSGGLGILGGSFNPPHIAHLLCAVRAREQLGLERVLLVPVHEPPHKRLADDPGVAQRLEMCRLAAAPIDWLEVSEIELQRPGPSYTVDTLRTLHQSDPELEMTLILGGDVAWTLGGWREPEAIFELARVAVAERAGVRRHDLREQLAGIAGSEALQFIEVPRLDVSSSQLRELVHEGRSIRFLVPDAVAAHIEREGLYA